MVNSICVCVVDGQGVERDMTVEAVHHDLKGYGIEHCNDFNITLSLDTGEELDMGNIHFSKGREHWTHDGDKLTLHEQVQLIEVIKDYKESDWDINE